MACRILQLLSLLVIIIPSTFCLEQDERLNCDPCIDRSKYRIRAILHGRPNDTVWQEMRDAMQQTAQDMKIDLEMTLYDENVDSFHLPQAMATDIRNAVFHQNPPPDALIVSLPGNPIVHREVETVQDMIPIFGVNALVPYSSTRRIPSLKAATYMDEQTSASMAGNQIRILLDQYSHEFDNDDILGIFINHEPGIELLTQRFNAIFNETMDIMEWTMAELENPITYEDDLTAIFQGCNYTVVQLAGVATVEATLTALVDSGCDRETLIVGTFDTSPLVYDAIAVGSMSFAISQQPHFQGRMSVLLASIYATTGETLVSLNNEIPKVFSSPFLVTPDNLPPGNNVSIICESDGFPVCSNATVTNTTSSSASCSCKDRSKMNIKILTHDLINDPFWDTVYSGLDQAASDFGIDLGTHRFQSAVTGRGEVSLERSVLIREACGSSDIDGLIVSLPHEDMIDALSVCSSRGIPVSALNAAPDDAVNHHLPFVGQNDYRSGFEAGQRLLEAGVVHGWCLIHEDLSSLKNRCKGMEAAFSERDAGEFMGVIHLSPRDTLKYKEVLETTLGSGNWSDYGVLSTGQIQIGALLSVVEAHPELKAGTFDVDSTEYDSLSDLFLFAIDQQPYLQGYLSLAMMTWRILTHRVPTENNRFETGPKFIVAPPTRGKRKCQETSYAICTPSPILKYSGKCADLGRLCDLCEGDCDDDSQCAEGLTCFVRDSRTLGAYQNVPGCSTNPIELNAKDFCVDSSLYTCKDEEQFRLRLSDGLGSETCSFVARDLSRCTMYGIYCRETCGYCRPRPSR